MDAHLNNWFGSKLAPVYNLFKKSVHFLFVKLLEPKTRHEDSKRREFILNIILFGSVVMLFVLDAFVLYYRLKLGNQDKGISFSAFSLILLGFITLYALSRFGKFILAAYLFIAVYFLANSYAAYHWGVDLQAVLLGYALLIVISSVLISTLFGFLLTTLISAYCIPLWYLQITSQVTASWYWKTDFKFIQVITFCVIFFVIMIVSWLSNREIEKSLHRARKSEAELKKERDLLEVKVEERTQELKKTQAEKMSQLYRFSEFGRLSSGIFHDLINPLTALAISFKQLQDTKNQDLEQAEQNLENGLVAARRMESFIQTIRKQLSHQETKVSFSLNEEAHGVVQLFEYKARHAKVTLHFVRQHDVQTFGDPLKFHQIVSNLVSNGIDAYDGIPPETNKEHVVEIRLAQHRDIARLEVQDRDRASSLKF